MPPIRIVLADDQELVRTGLRLVIDSQPDLVVVAEVSNGAEAVRAAGLHRPDLVVMDVRMPLLDGIEATRQIVAGPGAPRVVVLTTFDLDESALAALRAGASGFLLKAGPPHELLAGLRAVHSGDAVIAPSTTRRLLEHLIVPSTDSAAEQRLAALTDRERGVLVEMARGRSNAEIAADLFIAEGTVKTHIGRILAKLEVRDRVQAVVVAYEAGLVRPGGS